MSNIKISAGHSLKSPGATFGSHIEFEETVRVVSNLNLAHNGWKLFWDNESINAITNLNTIVNWHKKEPVTTKDLHISIHFNAFDTQVSGTEVLYNQAQMQPLADKLSAVISNCLGIRNRGARERNNLAFLNRLNNAVLIEVCFLDNTADMMKYERNFNKLIKEINEVLFDYYTSKS